MSALHTVGLGFAIADAILCVVWFMLRRAARAQYRDDMATFERANRLRGIQRKAGK